MRILFLTSELPYPPYAGAPMRNFGIIEGLADHEIWLLSFHSKQAIEPDRTPLARLCAAIATVSTPVRTAPDRLRTLLLTSEADIARRFHSPAFAAQLRQWLSATRFDVIQIENLEMAIYLPVIREVQPGTPVIYDAHNAEYALQQRIYETERGALTNLPGAFYSRLQAERVRRLEQSVCRRVDHIIAVSETDAGLLRALATGTPVTVVPNGISAHLYSQPAAEPVDLEKPALVFTGKMDYRPNIDAALWFGQEVLPLVRQELPNAHFYVVGQSPHPRLNVLRGQCGVTLTGLVPEVLPYLQAASVFVVPLRMGSGTRLKVLEAMAAGCPIVSTTIGVQGLAIKDGQEVMIADTAKEFARSVVRLYRDSEQASLLGEKARAFVQARYDWSVLLPRLRAVYRELGVG